MMRKESKCPRGVYKVKSFGTLQVLPLDIRIIYSYAECKSPLYTIDPSSYSFQNTPTIDIDVMICL